MAAPLLGAKKHPFPPLPTFQLSAGPGALIDWSLLWHWYLSPLRVYCTYISWTNVHFSFFRQTENNVFEPLSIRVECWNLFWSVSTGQVTKGQVWFWILTYKIIPDLWLLDLFCPHSTLLSLWVGCKVFPNQLLYWPRKILPVLNFRFFLSSLLVCRKCCFPWQIKWI